MVKMGFVWCMMGALTVICLMLSGCGGGGGSVDGAGDMLALAGPEEVSSAGCGGGGGGGGGGCQPIGLLSPMPIPADNPQTSAKISLGKQLYFDKRLSLDNSISCASCHDPNYGWGDPRQFSVGVGGALGGRNSPTVLNTGYNPIQFWDGRAATLEEQALGPIENPVEMAMTLPAVVSRLKAIPGYVSQFRNVFGADPSAAAIGKAIASFERVVVSTDSPFDRYVRTGQGLSSQARSGLMLFKSCRTGCANCHSGPNFTDNQFHNLGVGYQGGSFADIGRAAITGRPEDTGAFKTPTLRSVALTGPYLHDGSARTLREVVHFYNLGGAPNPYLDSRVRPLGLTATQEACLVAFLESLTGAPLNITPPTLP